MNDDGWYRFLACLAIVVAAGVISLVLFCWRMGHWLGLLG